MSKRLRPVAGAGVGAKALSKPGARHTSAALPSVASERSRLLDLIPHLPRDQLQRVLMDALRADDRVVGVIGSLVTHAAPSMAKCAVCHKKFEVSNNSGAACKSKEHDWDISGACDECGDSDCGDCARCGSTSCTVPGGTCGPGGRTADQCKASARRGTTAHFCYVGVHVEVLPRFIRADYDDVADSEGQ